MYDENCADEMTRKKERKKSKNEAIIKQKRVSWPKNHFSLSP